MGNKYNLDFTCYKLNVSAQLLHQFKQMGLKLNETNSVSSDRQFQHKGMGKSSDNLVHPPALATRQCPVPSTQLKIYKPRQL